MKKSSSILVNSNFDKNSIDSIAIGGFDGMHIAHQELFKNLNPNGAILSIETGYANLTPKSFREEYSKYPIYYYVLENIKKLEGVEFLNLLKSEFPKLEKIVVGFDFGFGKNRSCNSDDLKNLFNGEVVVIPEIKLNNIPVHSRHIRNFLKEGNIASANSFLGKNYKIFGVATKGQGIGKSDFVPTINLEVSEFLLPKDGVYISKTKIDNKYYNSVSFIGNRASTDNNFAVETHILDLDIEYKNPNIGIEFLEMIRENKKFNNFIELKQAILDDIKIARKYFLENIY